MSQLRLAKETDLRSFPGCHAVVNDTPPIAQCQETQIDSAVGSITEGLPTITDVGAFAGIDLAGKNATITLPIEEAGTYTILSNTDDVITTDHVFGSTDPTTSYTAHDEAQTYLTRNESSFIRFIETLGNAHTTLNGQLYTDVETGPLAAACSETYSPD